MEKIGIILELDELSKRLVFVREIVNGSVTIAGIFIIGVFGHYVWCNWDSRKDNVAVKASIAILVLTIGHVLRAAYSWVTFMAVDLGWNVSAIIDRSATWFIASAIMVLIGKALMLLNFSPWSYRKIITTAAIVAAVVIPVGLALIL